MSDDPYRAPEPAQDSLPLYRRLTPLQISLLILLVAFFLIWRISGSAVQGLLVFVLFGVVWLLGGLAGGSAGGSKDD